MDDLKSKFDHDGFVVIPGFLPPEELAELAANLERYIRDVVPGLPQGDAFYIDRTRPETLKQLQHMEGDPYFRDYLNHPAWLRLAQTLLDDDPAPMSVEWFNKPPGSSSPTPPHQDNYYFCLQPPNVLTIWLALDPVDEENGCLRYVAGSHRRGIRGHAPSRILGFSQGISDYGEEDRAAEVVVRLRPGDAVAHHGNTIHRAEANRSPVRNRRAFAMVVRATSARRDEAAFARYLEALRVQHQGLGLNP